MLSIMLRIFNLSALACACTTCTPTIRKIGERGAAFLAPLSVAHKGYRTHMPCSAHVCIASYINTHPSRKQNGVGLKNLSLTSYVLKAAAALYFCFEVFAFHSSWRLLLCLGSTMYRLVIFTEGAAWLGAQKPSIT